VRVQSPADLGEPLRQGLGELLERAEEIADAARR
jgi:hypothetical protein